MQRPSCRNCRSPDIPAQTEVFKPNPMLALGLGLVVITFFAVAMLALTSLVHPAQAADLAETPSAERQRELTRFVRQECGFCHGIHLTGGLGSPLTAAALAGKSSDALEASILYGRTGTAMPGWMPHLNESDANWIVTALMKGFPE
jgi:cytochrome c55X